MAAIPHIKAFDSFRLMGAFAIVVLHLRMQPCAGLRIVNAAVPLFALLAGFFTVMGVKPDPFPLGRAIRQRVSRLLVPYAFWTGAYWILNSVLFDAVFSGQPFHWPTIGEWIRIVTLGAAGPHLWFLPCLFYGQALLLFGLWLCRRTRLDERFYVVCVLLIALGCSLWLPGRTSATLTGYLRIYFFRLLLFLCLGGMYAYGMPWVLKQRMGHGPLMLLLPMGVAVGWILLAVGTAKGLIWAHLLIVSALFWWGVIGAYRAQHASRSSAGRYDIVLAEMAKCAMGIYLAHVIFTTMANVAGRKMGLAPFSLALGLLIAACVFAVSLASVWMAGKVPVLRRVLM